MTHNLYDVAGHAPAADCAPASSSRRTDLPAIRSALPEEPHEGWHARIVRRRGSREWRDQTVGLLILAVLLVGAVLIGKALGDDSRRGVLATFGILTVLAGIVVYFGEAIWDAISHRSDQPGRHSRD